ncbi:MAG: hypothetical protein MZV65_35025 [Chromatiales bacterium]|nr:hypothetical protein [Chromatiales bacterium]
MNTMTRTLSRFKPEAATRTLARLALLVLVSGVAAAEPPTRPKAGPGGQRRDPGPVPVRAAPGPDRQRRADHRRGTVLAGRRAGAGLPHS